MSCGTRFKLVKFIPDKKERTLMGSLFLNKTIYDNTIHGKNLSNPKASGKVTRLPPDNPAGEILLKVITIASQERCSNLLSL